MFGPLQQKQKQPPELYLSVSNNYITVGMRAEPALETGTRLAPGERQSGDGTSLPETPNNLTNVCRRPLFF